MLKTLAIFASLTLLTVCVSGQPSKAAERKQENAKQSQPAVLPMDSPNKLASDQTNQAESGSNPPAGNTTLERPQVWWRDSNWYLVLVAIATAIVIGWQSWETRKAAKGAGEAADAAITQIKTMKDRERARLSVCEVFKPLLAFNSRPNEFFPIPMKVTLYLINDGNSPAFNVRAEGHVFAEKLIDEPTLCVSDDREDWYRLAVPGTIREIGNSSRTEIIVTCRADTKRENSQPIDNATAAALMEGHLTLMIGGEISYEDIFGDEHKTPFLFLWEVRGEEGIGRWGVDSSWVDLSGDST